MSYQALQKEIDRLYTQKGLAEALGIAQQTVVNHHKAGMPVAIVVKGEVRNYPRYSLEEAKKWLANRVVKARGRPPGNGGASARAKTKIATKTTAKGKIISPVVPVRAKVSPKAAAARRTRAVTAKGC